MAIETDTVTLPAAWACALINGDYTGFDYNGADEAEAQRCEAAEAALAADGWSIVDCADEPRFTNMYRLYDAGADFTGGDVLDYTVLRAVADTAMTVERE